MFLRFSAVFSTFFLKFSISGRNYPVERIQPFFVDEQIRQSKQGIEMSRILGQSAITDLAQPNWVV